MHQAMTPGARARSPGVSGVRATGVPEGRSQPDGVTQPWVGVEGKARVHECPADCTHRGERSGGERSLGIQSDECVDCGAFQPIRPEATDRAAVPASPARPIRWHRDHAGTDSAAGISTRPPTGPNGAALWWRRPHRHAKPRSGSGHEATDADPQRPAPGVQARGAVAARLVSPIAGAGAISAQVRFAPSWAGEGNQALHGHGCVQAL